MPGADNGAASQSADDPARLPHNGALTDLSQWWQQVGDPLLVQLIETAQAVSPSAPHRYIFTLYATAVDKLEVAGSVPKTGTAGLYGFVLNKGLGTALLGKASFTATFGRP